MITVTALATECSNRPPCARILPSSILFLGTVVGNESIDGTPTRRIRLRVDERFAGLADDVQEELLTTRWDMQPGRQYLIDAARDFAKFLGLQTCSVTAEITSTEPNEMLEFLRARARRETATMLTVRSQEILKPVAGITVKATGNQLRYEQTTNSYGIAFFPKIVPGRYSLTGAAKHYTAAPNAFFNSEIEVVEGTCGSAVIGVKADGRVIGVVKDWKGVPVPSLRMEMLPAPLGSSYDLYFAADTNSDGQFAFESVSPGRYLIGTNLTDDGSTIPKTFFPSTHKPEDAVPIEVQLGATTGPIEIKLANFGEHRKILLCAVDEGRKPVAFAEVDSGSVGAGSAVLAGNHKSDETGCFRLTGYTRVNYGVMIRLSDKGLFSAGIPIRPGSEAVEQTVVLRRQ